MHQPLHLPDNTPIIIGAAQYTQRWQDDTMPQEPLALCERCAREAAAQTQHSNIWQYVDSVYVVNIFGYGYADAPRELAARIGFAPQHTHYSVYGGNTPQHLVNIICQQLESGEAQAVLLTGGEANYGLSKALKAGMKLDWTPRQNPQYINGQNDQGNSDLAANYELFLPTNTYPLIETALRYANQQSIEAHQQALGALYEKMAAVAAQNPHAWTRQAYTAEEIAQPSDDNRYVSYPYTKRMCANNNVDQAAALLLTTAGKARSWGIPQALWVVPMGGATLYDVWDLECRPDITRSPAIRAAARQALAQANLSLDQIDAFDIYSCFPSAVQIGRSELDIAQDDPRPYTLTGGLSFFGGPWNNYSMHAIVSAVHAIQHNTYECVMITALGWFITKHSVGIYGKNAPAVPWGLRDDSTLQQEINSTALPPALSQAEGNLRVLGYNLMYNRHNLPDKGVVLGELADGSRTFAYIEADTNALLRYHNEELVGKTGKVYFHPDKKRNFVRFDNYAEN